MKKLEKILGNSFINYLSDLFVAVAVIAWIIIIAIVTWAAIYAEIVFYDTSVWPYVVELVAAPITAGLGVWMVKNCVQHAIANNKGKIAKMDFPKVPDTDDEELEEELYSDGEEDELG